MNHSGPLLTLILTAGFVLAPARSTAASTGNPDEKKPPLALLTLAEGDVRYSPNNEDLDPRKPWVLAEDELTIKNKSALATEDGRAEIELQGGAKIFLAENSVIVFINFSLDPASVRGEVDLVVGTATIFVPETSMDSIDLRTQAHYMRIRGGTFMRVDSYADGTLLTPEGAGGGRLVGGNMHTH
jgi:hypothetical protein